MGSPAAFFARLAPQPLRPNMLALALVFSPLVPQTDDRPYSLMVGDAAPAIQVAEWVQGTPVTSFAPGQTTVVEFWATWCGQCKVAIPHLNELSKEYAGKVTFVGVSVWERISAKAPYSVPDFVKKMGDKMTYTVASDLVKETEDEGPMAKNWMSAAGQSGIPTAFVVNGSGRIAWIGHPMELDKSLAAIVGGSYDVDAAAKKYAADVRQKAAQQKLAKDVTKAKKAKDFAAALRLIDEALAKDKGLEASFGIEKYFLLLELQKTAEAATYGQHLVADVIGTNPMALNSLSWSIVDPQGKWKTGD